jgi:preprotein translocase subunit SecY
MFAAFFNSLKVKELRTRIFFVAGVIVLCRIAATIPCPGVDPHALQLYVAELSKSAGGGGGVFGMFNLFSGGALQKFAVATLGIMPYISASIIMTLLTPVLPALEKLQRQGDVGRQKINQYMRYLTVVICIVQGAMAATAMLNPSRLGLKAPPQELVIVPHTYFIIMTIIILTAGTMLLVWLGEQITKHGIGQGISLIITVNIVARLPQAVGTLYEMAVTGGGITNASFRGVHVLILILIFVVVTAATILITQGQRRVPIQKATKAVGAKARSGNTTYLPLKINHAGVMPIIFASAILSFLSMFIRWIPFTQKYAVYFMYGSAGYIFTFGALIIIFSYFWVANQFNPIQIADNLKREGAYVPGIRPGQPTAKFLDYTMTRITLAGSIFLAALALFPMFLYKLMGIPPLVSAFFGGTSLLIIVGVLLDTISQLESHLVMRNYDGFLKKGRVRGRRMK